MSSIVIHLTEGSDINEAKKRDKNEECPATEELARLRRFELLKFFLKLRDRYTLCQSILIFFLYSETKSNKYHKETSHKHCVKTNPEILDKSSVSKLSRLLSLFKVEEESTKCEFNVNRKEEEEKSKSTTHEKRINENKLVNLVIRGKVGQSEIVKQSKKVAVRAQLPTLSSFLINFLIAPHTFPSFFCILESAKSMHSNLGAGFALSFPISSLSKILKFI